MMADEVEKIVYCALDDGQMPVRYWPSWIYSDGRGYRDHPDTVIPPAAIEISEEQWQYAVERGGGVCWVDGEWQDYEPPGVPLLDIKAVLKAQVDAAAERERARYITPGAGQAMTYQAKADEARRLAADPSPDAADYPLLSAEVGITAPDLVAVGAVVLAAYQAWQVIGAAIEGARLGAKQAIDLATDEAGARAAAEVTWPA